MPVFFLHHLLPGRRSQPEAQALVKLHDTIYNTNEGSEFLDDAIRNDEFDPAGTEEEIAPGSPE